MFKSETDVHIIFMRNIPLIIIDSLKAKPNRILKTPWKLDLRCSEIKAAFPNSQLGKSNPIAPTIAQARS